MPSATLFAAIAGVLALVVRIAALIIVIVRPLGGRGRLALAGFALLLTSHLLGVILNWSGLGIAATPLMGGFPYWADDLAWAAVELVAAIGVVLIAASVDQRRIRWRERALPLVLLLIVLEVIIAVFVVVTIRGDSALLVAHLASPVIAVDGVVVAVFLIIGSAGRTRALGLAGLTVMVLVHVIDIVRRIDYWIGDGVPSLFPVTSTVDMAPAFAYSAFRSVALAVGIVLLLLAVLQRPSVSRATAARSSR